MFGCLCISGMTIWEFVLIQKSDITFFDKELTIIYNKFECELKRNTTKSTYHSLFFRWVLVCTVKPWFHLTLQPVWCVRVPYLTRTSQWQVSN